MKEIRWRPVWPGRAENKGVTAEDHQALITYDNASLAGRAGEATAHG